MQLRGKRLRCRCLCNARSEPRAYPTAIRERRTTKQLLKQIKQARLIQLHRSGWWSSPIGGNSNSGRCSVNAVEVEVSVPCPPPVQRSTATPANVLLRCTRRAPAPQRFGVRRQSDSESADGALELPFSIWNSPTDSSTFPCRFTPHSPLITHHSSLPTAPQRRRRDISVEPTIKILSAPEGRHIRVPPRGRGRTEEDRRRGLLSFGCGRSQASKGVGSVSDPKGVADISPGQSESESGALGRRPTIISPPPSETGQSSPLTQTPFGTEGRTLICAQPSGGCKGKGMLRMERAAMEKPNEVDAESKHSPGFWGYIIWPTVVLMLYVLSFGPLYGSHSRSVIAFRETTTLSYIYLPVAWGYDNVPPFQKAMYVYMRWWDPTWN
jgi:hypothetical protein